MSRAMSVSATCLLAAVLAGCGSLSDEEIPEALRGKWKDANDTISLSFEDNDMCFFVIWAGPPDAAGKRAIDRAGFVKWAVKDGNITFEGNVAKGTMALVDGGDTLRVSWDSNKAVLQKEE